MRDYEISSWKDIISKLKSKLKHAISIIADYEKTQVHDDSKTLLELHVVLLGNDLLKRIEQISIENQKLRSMLLINQDNNSLNSFKAEYTKLENEMRKPSNTESDEVPAQIE